MVSGRRSELVGERAYRRYAKASRTLNPLRPGEPGWEQVERCPIQQINDRLPTRDLGWSPGHNGLSEVSVVDRAGEADHTARQIRTEPRHNRPPMTGVGDCGDLCQAAATHREDEVP
jgi:hypothetical protein